MTTIDQAKQAVEEMAELIAKIPPIKYTAGERAQGRHIFTSRHIARYLYKHGYRKQSEVAREIFEEIADNLRGLFDFFRQDDCIRESSAIMLAISEIAELKKKYVPDTDVPTKVSSGDICVVCGEPIPKERQVCSMCETGQEFLRKRRE